MDTPAGSVGPAGSAGQARKESAGARQAVEAVAKYWWAWLVAGIVWIAASVAILQINRTSFTVVGIVIGIMFLVAGLQEFALAYITPGGWNWLWIAFGVLLVGGGIWALVNPIATFVATANILGFVFLLIGVGWTIQAFASMETSPVWGLNLAAGIIMFILGFWAASQLLITQAYTLLVFAGIWALLHGITDIVKAFMIRRVGKSAVETGAVAPGAVA